MALPVVYVTKKQYICRTEADAPLACWFARPDVQIIGIVDIAVSGAIVPGLRYVHQFSSESAWAYQVAIDDALLDAQQAYRTDHGVHCRIGPLENSV